MYFCTLVISPIKNVSATSKSTAISTPKPVNSLEIHLTIPLPSPPPPAYSSPRREKRRPVMVTDLLPYPQPICAIDPLSLIINEIILVTSAMRKTARWASSGVAAILGGSLNGDEEDEGLAVRWGLRQGKRANQSAESTLIAEFSKLRAELADCKDITTFDLPSLLGPFLAVIRSSATSGQITSLALTAIMKFFSYRIITQTSPRLPLAMQILSSAVTHCRFEATDPGQDEVVLLRILKTMEMMLSGVGGGLLGDESICEMMETGLSMCCQTRLSEMLRRSAEMAMLGMVQIIFERLKGLEPEQEFTSDAGATESEVESTVKETVIAGTPSQFVSDRNRDRPHTPTLPSNLSVSKAKSIQKESAVTSIAQSSASSDPNLLISVTLDTIIKPYGLASIRELLRVLVSLLDPHNRQHTDTMRVMALRIIDVAFEVAGTSIGLNHSLRKLATDDLCRYLFQLVRSDQPLILSNSLRVTSTLLHTMRPYLKLQQELFLSYVVACLQIPKAADQITGGSIDFPILADIPNAPRLSTSPSGRSTPIPVKERQRLGLEGSSRGPDAREVMVECIAGLTARIPTFMIDLFINYDCEVDLSDLCEDVVGFLSRNAFPDAAGWSTPNVPPLCLNALLAYVGYIADRLDVPHDDVAWSEDTKPEKLLARRERKKIIVQGASKFNSNPKEGLEYLAEQGILDEDLNPTSVARFLKKSSRVSKRIVGEYIAKPSNAEVLDAFVNLFDFKGKRLDEALREMLTTFRLPGEAQQIDRIMENFARRFFESGPEEVRSQDAAYVLAFSVVMLNTDQHNPQVKKRMTLIDFIKNLKGVNDSHDFSPEYLEAIYNAIRSREIIMPEEHDNQAGFDHAWKELLQKAEVAGELLICTSNVYDSYMFAATWRPVVATLSYVFASATDDTVFKRVITGLDQCARIAARYGLHEVLDQIILCLTKICTLAGDDMPSTKLNIDVIVEENTITVSELAVRFGRDFTGQLATVVLFSLCEGRENEIRDGWKHIVRILMALSVNGLLPKSFSPLSGRLPWVAPIPLRDKPIRPARKHDQSKDSGLFSTLSSYLSNYATDEPSPPSDEEIERTMCTVDCIKSCHLDEVSQNLIKLDPEGSKSLMNALLEKIVIDAPEVQEPSAQALPTLRPREGSPVNGQEHQDSSYDPSMLFLLEMATSLAIRDENSMRDLSVEVIGYCTEILRQRKHLHPIWIERSLIYLLVLKKRGDETGVATSINLTDIIRILLSTQPPLFHALAVTLVRSLLELGQVDINLVLEDPRILFQVLKKSILIPEAQAPEFALCKLLVDTDDGAFVTAKVYPLLINILGDFATLGSVGAEWEQRNDVLQKRFKQSKTPDKPHVDQISRAKTALDLICTLHIRALTLISHSDNPAAAWGTFFTPILESLTRQSINPCREVRTAALSLLQRLLLLPTLLPPRSPETAYWPSVVFEKSLLHLINELLRPDVFATDKRGMGETRVIAQGLLCKIFLHCLGRLVEEDMGSGEHIVSTVWSEILDVLIRLVGSGQKDVVEEAVPESLKNVLLVMAAQGILIQPSLGGGEVWDLTWQKLERALPKLRSEIFPGEARTSKEYSSKSTEQVEEGEK